ncbi:MAG: hypothetical protein K2O52_06315 [Oscillospiraceae bacterium]|nr:hypothetical protein [Oscillospiraceae bacterium]
MNPMAIMQIKPLLEKFQQRHPKFIQFFNYAGQQIGEDSLIEISVTSPDDKKVVTNIRLSQEDLELIEKLKSLIK